MTHPDSETFNFSLDSIVEEKVISSNTVKRYRKGKFLGKGGFARVYELQDLETKYTYAAKIIPKLTLANPRSKRKVFSEIKIHKSLSHPNIVKFFHCFEDFENIYILLELCSNQTLSELVKTKGRLSETEVKCYSLSVLNAVQCLHSNGILHRDLKLSNLFLTENFEVKIGDFGLACKLSHFAQRRKTICGTPNYIAPEVMYSCDGYSYEADIWSVGVLMYSMLVGKPPFESDDIKGTYQKIKRASFEFPEGMLSRGATELIKSILVTPPEDRPSIEGILKNGFLRNNVNVPVVVSSRLRGDNGFHIEKWVEYRKYGVGYLLSNGQIGGCFNDETGVLDMPLSSRVMYMPRSGAEANVYERTGCPEFLRKKVAVLEYFMKFFDSENTEIAGDFEVYVRKFFRTPQGVGFWLSSEVIHLLFADESEVVLEIATKTMKYIDQTGTQTTLHVSEIVEGTELHLKLRYCQETIGTIK